MAWLYFADCSALLEVVEVARVLSRHLRLMHSSCSLVVAVNHGLCHCGFWGVGFFFVLFFINIHEFTN